MSTETTPPQAMQLPATYAKLRPLPTFKRTISLAEAKHYWWLSDAAQKLGVHIVAGSGSGKSRLMGRLLAWDAVKRRKPLVILDPTGDTILNLLDVITRLPLALRKQIWPRILYVDAGATDYIVPTPLYYRVGDTDSLFEIANRLPSIYERQDSALAEAPILGLNALKECATYAGLIAAALHKQLDFVLDLVIRPGECKAELQQALAVDPSLARAVAYFRQLMDATGTNLREKRLGSFLTKLLPFVADPLHLARYAVETHSIDWEKVAQEGLTVLIDLRRVRDHDRRQFALLYYFQSFTAYIKDRKDRGQAARGQEIRLIIDEISQLLKYRTADGRSLMAEDLEELLTVYARSAGVNVVIAHQALNQVEPAIQSLLMRMGTQIIGRIGNHEDVLAIAKDFLRYDPYWVKKVEIQWAALKEGAAHDLDPFGITNGGEGYIAFSERTVRFPLNQRTVEFTPEEQVLLLADQFKQLGRFRFIVRAATAEGTISHHLRRISLERLDAGLYPDESYLASIRQCLRAVSGVPADELLAAITPTHPRRLPAPQAGERPENGKRKRRKKKPAQKNGFSAHDTIEGTPAHDETHPTPGTAPAPAADDDFWQEGQPHGHPLDRA